MNTSIDGKIFVFEAQVLALEGEKDKIIRRARSLRGLVSPWLDSLSVHKKECIDMVGKPTPAERNDKMSLAHMLNGLVSIFDTFKSGSDTYIELLERAYLEIFKCINL